jgi:O-methyltransferase
MIDKKQITSFIKRRFPTFLVVWYLSRENSKRKKLVPEIELEKVYERCLTYLMERGIPIGDYLEFGVYCGSSMICMNNALSNLNMDDVRLIGFDSFQGLPATARSEGWSEWDYCMSLKNTQKFLAKNNVDLKKTILIKGWFSKTLNNKTKRKYNIAGSSIIMIDCDIYTSTAQVLKFIEPLLGEKCFLVFDDWKSLDAKGNENGELGQKRAFAEFLKKFPHYEYSPFDSYGRNSEVILLKKKQLKIEE